MLQLLSLSHAARPVGTSRVALQQKIRSGDRQSPLRRPQPAFPCRARCEGRLRAAGIRRTAWADALDNFRYTTVTEGGAHDLVAGMVKDHADLAVFDIYLAGPEGFVEGAAKALAQQGFSSGITPANAGISLL